MGNSPKPQSAKKESKQKHGNQHKADPRQATFLSLYFDPLNKATFSNAYKSAIEAGYSEEYAQNITNLMPEWLSESIGDSYLVSTAEANLKEMLTMDTTQPVVTMVGPVKNDKGEVLRKENPNLKKIKADMTKFTLERLNKDKYSSRSEMTGKNGGPLQVMEDSPDALKTLFSTFGAALQNISEESS